MAAPRAVWLILPTYNEADNLARIVGAASAALPPTATILIVDDSSPDGTGQVADGLAAKAENVQVLHREAKRGIGPAYVAGFKRALAGGASLVVQMDADFSHNPVDLPRLLAAADRADLVIGSRYVDGGSVGNWGPIRRTISRAGSAYSRGVLGVGVADLTGGFKVIRRAVLEAIALDTIASRGYAFQIELTYRAIRTGFRVVEVPIEFRDRNVGESKMTGGIVAEAALGVPRMRLRRRSWL